MYRLMIVDDEPIVLKAISHVVEVYCPQIRIVGRTGSGLEAVSLALREKPDIIMMDIELTGLNGLEASREIKKALPETIIVIISAYDNFHYARQAIALGVMDYLLKPVAKDDILTLVSKALNRLEEQRDKTREQLELKDRLTKVKPFLEEDLFFSLLYPGMGRHALEEYPGLLELQFEIGQAVEVVSDDPRWQQQFEQIKPVIKSRLSAARAILFGPVIGRTSFILLGWDHVPKSLKTGWEGVWEALQTTMGITIGVILGPMLPGFTGMADSFRRLRQWAWQAKELAGVFCLEELAQPADEKLSIPWKVEQTFFEAIKGGRGELARLLFEDLYRIAEAVFGGDLQSLKDYFQGIIAVLQRVFYETATEGESCPLWDGNNATRRIARIGASRELPILFEEIIREISQAVVDGLLDEKNPEIRAAIHYMTQNYHREIGLSDIAAAVAISPGYLSKLFKECQNQTVMDFLERVRIEAALKLLKETHYPVKEIAARVGYRDPNYFSKVFKKVTNASPTEIRG